MTRRTRRGLQWSEACKPLVRSFNDSTNDDEGAPLRTRSISKMQRTTVANLVTDSLYTVFSLIRFRTDFVYSLSPFTAAVVVVVVLVVISSSSFFFFTTTDTSQYLTKSFITYLNVYSFIQVFTLTHTHTHTKTAFATILLNYITWHRILLPFLKEKKNIIRSRKK